MQDVIANAVVVTREHAFPGRVVIEDGVIAAVEESGRRLAGDIDLQSDFLIAGLVDVHSDNIEKHFAPRPGVEWPSIAAAVSHDTNIVGAGITTVLDSVSLSGKRGGVNRAEISGRMIEGLRQAQDRSLLRADHLLHLRCEVADPQIIDRFSPYRDDPLVRLMSLMDHTPGQRGWADVNTWREYRRKQGVPVDKLDVMLVEEQAAHAEHAARNRVALAKIASDLGLVMATHDDATPEQIAEAVELGNDIAEFPTSLAAAEAAHEHDLKIVMGAPNLVRGASHLGNLSSAQCAQAGLLDILASDYVPISLLHAAFRLTSEPFGFSLPRALGTVTWGPAETCRLTDRGEIAVGRRADLVRVHDADGTPVVRAVWRAGERVQ